MNRANMIDTVNRFLIDEFEVEPSDIVLQDNMHEVLDLDSLDYVDLVVVVQSNFGFKLTADDFKGIDSFEDFYNLIERHLEANTVKRA